MLDPLTITKIGCACSNIHKVCMHRYLLSANYLQLKDKDQNKGATVYIDGSPKATGNIAGFIKSTQLGSTLKQPNYILERHGGNHVFVCAIKSILAGE